MSVEEMPAADMAAEAADEPLLLVRGLRTEFRTDAGTVHAVNDVSFELAKGESLAIVGESGSGKSVTVQSIMGLIRIPPGRIAAGKAFFRGRDLLAMKDEDLRRVRGREIAMIFQDPMSSLNPVLTVGLQLTETLREHEPVSEVEARRQAIEMLDLVGISDAERRMKDHPHEFSGGQLQRIGIAMALVCRPQLLIADEPTTALDVTIQAQIVELVLRLQRQFGMSILWISHDLGLVAGLVDRVAVMYGGILTEIAPVHELYGRPSHPYTLGLLNSIPRVSSAAGDLVPIAGAPPNLLAPPTSCPFAPRCAFAVDRCRTERPLLTDLGSGHAAACHELETVAARKDAVFDAPARAKRDLTGAKVILRVEDLRKHFPIRRGVLRRQVGAVRALDGISFDLRQGETLGVVGESGCGKSTAGRAILGLLDKDGGKVTFQGVDDAARDTAGRMAKRRDMQMIFQDPYGSLNPRMTVGRIVGEGLRAHGIGNGAEQDARVAELLELVGLMPAWKQRYPHELSGGQRQRVGIARALATEPRLIIADEPISALDVSIQAQVVNLMQRLKGELGLTYLFIGHDLSMVRHISDRVAVMYLGRIVEIGTTASVFDRTLHPYTRALMSAIPEPDPEAGGTGGRIVLEGGVPSPANPPPGCYFHPRCAHATDVCRTHAPDLRDFKTVDGTEHRAACHHVEALCDAVAAPT